ncbi:MULTISPECIES: hypothetical protein [Actinomadura]|uniref:Uncharacterized protein n=1 Tax=Actinomadura yumaensis TaxID=111807 RepID=A0ABW2C9L6_9ACTN|nr:hypothetical protein [Actinomadura sp. J1-007]MWK33776.1 hypothetical protein [Actinomadura sp. J1-007]
MAFLPPSHQPPPPGPAHRPPGPHAGPPAGPPPAGGSGARPVTVLGLRGRQWMVVAIVLGCCYLSTSAAALTGAWATLRRDPTNAELQRAANAEVARRWQAWPAGRIFPDRVSYQPEEGDSEYATRMGIATTSTCGDAVDPDLAVILGKHGCRAVLRATYADRLQGVVITVGVVAFPDPWRADAAYKEIPSARDAGRAAQSGGVRPALRAAPFPGTAAARFDDAARQTRSSDRGGPYVLLSTAGQADGRPAAAVKKQRPGDVFGPEPQIAHQIARALSVRSLPDCRNSEWRC